MGSVGKILVVIACFGLPFYLVIRMNRKGILFGALVMWFAVYAAGEIDRAGDPNAERFGLGLWIMIGWLFSLVYCSLIYGVKKIFLLVKSRLAAKGGG